MARPKKTKTVEESNPEVVENEVVSDEVVEDVVPEVMEPIVEPVTAPPQKDNAATIERQRRRTLGFI
jgi:hypothetical protein